MSIYNVFLGYGGKKIIKLFITGDTNNYNVLNAAQTSGQGYTAGTTKIEVTVNSGVIVGSASPASPAMTISGFTNGDEVTLINNGTIIGAGGRGGDTGYEQNRGQNGGAGGNAIQVGYNVSIRNNGIISGGGGGGGGAPGYNYNGKSSYNNFTGQGGGGGGAGRIVGAGGYGLGSGGSGSSGSLYTGGAPGVNNDGPYANSRGGYAGRGGDAGQPGQNATSPFGSGNLAGGGAAGKYVDGNGLVAWAPTGDRRGNVS